MVRTEQSNRSMDAPESAVHAGWREWACLPLLSDRSFRAKLDTGARTSALAATHIRMKGDAVHFRAIGQTRECQAPLADERWITDAGGHRELRPVIVTTLTLGSRHMEVEITLTARRGLRYRMLVGRSALSIGRFLIDPSVSYQLGKP